MADDNSPQEDQDQANAENKSHLDDAQQLFIDECDKLFANRYTEDDPDYKKLSEDGIGDPPIVDPWYSKPRRNYNWSGQQRNYNQQRREGDRRNDRYDDRRDGYRNYDRRDRHRNSGDDSHRRQNYYGHRHNPYWISSYRDVKYWRVWVCSFFEFGLCQFYFAIFFVQCFRDKGHRYFEMVCVESTYLRTVNWTVFM